MNAPDPSRTRANLGPMPQWDLSDLYPAMDSPLIDRDLTALLAEARAFEERYKDRLGDLAGDQLAGAVKLFENLQDRIGRIMSYAGLMFTTDQTDPKIGQFYQTMQERVNDVTLPLLFFTLELNRLEDAALEKKFSASAALEHYRPWIRDLRLFRPYQLSDTLEKLLLEKSLTARNAWTRLFDETIAAMRVTVDGESLTEAEALHLLSEKDAAKRRAAAMALSKAFEDRIALFALVTNTLAKDKEIEDRWRGLPAPETARHISNVVEAEVVEALHEAVVASFPRIAHRYYAMKAKWLGGERLDWWDRNAPLPQDEDRVIPWAEAQTIVLDAYRRFSPQLADIGQRFFREGWIDAPVRPGKASGAFSHPTVPSAHPYILMNYQGKTRDVMTLAHELGHGVHQVLAAGQGALMADTPLTLAETASVFGEQLTFQALLAQAEGAQKKRLLTMKVEDMLNTVVRQIAFYRFEKKVHAERRQGELTPERLGELWLEVQAESLGPALNFTPEYRHFWCYIPHFIHSPFYVYAYAFGDCLVNALYARYQDAHQGFQDKYLAMLAQGGRLRHKELLAPFGLDASDPAFWQKGLGVIEDFVSQLEALDKAG